jgi:hypothetical protein
MIAAAAAAMYISNGGIVTCGYGEAVGAAESTLNAVTACDGQ